MLSVAYVSAATEQLPRSGLVDLMNYVRRTNPELGVSGMLLCCDGKFMQLLEGPEEAVRPLYARIQADPRHAEVVTLFEEHVERRQFKEGTMGLRQMTPRELENISGWRDLQQAAHRDDSANRDAVYHLLLTFRRTMG